MPPLPACVDAERCAGYVGVRPVGKAVELPGPRAARLSSSDESAGVTDVDPGTLFGTAPGQHGLAPGSVLAERVRDRLVERERAAARAGCLESLIRTGENCFGEPLLFVLP